MIHCCDLCAVARGYTMRCAGVESGTCLHCGRRCRTLFCRGLHPGYDRLRYRLLEVALLFATIGAAVGWALHIFFLAVLR